MADLTSEEDYKPTHYFKHRHGDEKVVHCIGNSTDNLMGLINDAPAPHVKLPDAPHQPISSSLKPQRSDLEADNLSPQQPAPHPVSSSQVYVHTADADAFRQTEYYDELRRRSLEGRAPMHFNDGGANPLQETMSSEEFDVALY